MNTPVSFEIAKLVKEHGFKLEDPGYEDHKYSFYAIKDFDNDWRDSFSKRREGELLDGYYLAPLTEERKNVVIVAPTIADVITWLYEKHGIWVWIQPYKDHSADNNEPYSAQMNVWKNGVTVSKEFNTPTEAYLAAIEHTLNNLI